MTFVSKEELVRHIHVYDAAGIGYHLAHEGVKARNIIKCHKHTIRTKMSFKVLSAPFLGSHRLRNYLKGRYGGIDAVQDFHSKMHESIEQFRSSDQQKTSVISHNFSQSSCWSSIGSMTSRNCTIVRGARVS
jgi:hypothetical protein